MEAVTSQWAFEYHARWQFAGDGCQDVLADLPMRVVGKHVFVGR